MIILTNSVLKYFTFLLSKKKNTRIRVFFIKNKRECIISYCLIKKIKLSDILIKFKKIIIYVNKINFFSINKIKIDLINIGLNSKIKILNLNVNNKKNLLFNDIKKFIKFKINPKLKLHGGGILLIKVTSNFTAIIKFIGNCNECSIINSTFENNIKIKLFRKFPELKNIKRY